ncbi:MAG: hypothetical protein K8L97_04760 [Anaerolineae bacterium]|nr:hypothetical protein [Anaerolineae bacterium]
MRYTGSEYDYFDEDDDDENIDDDDLDEEDDEESGSASKSRVNPFTNAGMSAASRPPASPSSGVGRTSGLPGSTSGMSSRLPGSVGPSRPGSPTTSSGSSNAPGSPSTPRYGTPGSSSSPSSTSGSGQQRYTPSGSSGSSSGSSSSSPSSTSGSRYGSTPSTPSSTSGSSTSKPPEKKDDKSSGGIGSRLGGLTSRFGGGAKPDDKKPASTSSTRPGEAPKSSNPISGLTSRFGGGAKPADNKPATPKSSSSSGGGIASRLGGLTSRFGGAKADDKKPTTSSSSASSVARPGGTSSPSSTAKPFGSASGAASPRPFGSASGASSPTMPGSKPAAKPAEQKTGLGRFLPFGGGQSEADKKAAERKARASKAPKVESGGLTLDNKLDIIGVALVLGALALFFSALSTTKGQLTEAVNNFLGQLFGWGAIAIPAAMLAIGIWLIARHFGEQAPVVPTTRIIGIVMVYIGALALLMFAETFNYSGDRRVTNLQELRLQMKWSWEIFHTGGGWVGAQLYDILVTNIGEIGAFFGMIGWLVVGLMFTFSLSVAEIAVIVMSVGRSFGQAVSRRQERKAAAATAMTTEQMAALGTAGAVLVSKPEPDALPAGPSLPALPAASGELSLPAPELVPQRNIAINVGGRTLKDDLVPVGNAPAAFAPAAASGAPRQTDKPAASTPGSLTARLRGALPGGHKSAETTGTSTPPPAKPDTEKPAAATTGGGFRGMFNRGGVKEEAPKPAAPAPSTPAHASFAPPAPATQQPAATSSPPTVTKPNEEQPTRLGDLLRPASAQTSEPPKPVSAFSASPPKPPGLAQPVPKPITSTPAFDIDDEDEDEDEEDEELTRLSSLPPAQPKGTGPAPRPEDANKSRFGVSTFGAPKPGEPPTPDRQDRLNALRSGMADPAKKSEDAVNGTPAEKPAASVVTGTTAPSFAASRPTPFQPAKPAGPTGTPATPAAASTEKPAAASTPTAASDVPATPKAPTPAAPFWKPSPDAAKQNEVPLPSAEAKPPAPTYGRPTMPPGVPEPAKPVTATPPAAERPNLVINTPQPAAPPPPRAGVGPTAPANVTRKRKDWRLPNTSNLLMPGSEGDFDRTELLRRAKIIEDTLNSFGAPGKVVEVNTGPVITQFGVEPDYLVTRGGKKNRVKVSAIAQLDKDLQLALGAKSIRIEAPVPGKGYVGIEVPNEVASLVSLRDVMESKEFKRIQSPLTIALGQSVDGTPIAADLSSMPHLLVAGTTGSGKSVCVNAIITSIIINNPPDRVKFIMVDPKRVELTGYNGIPHLVAPVVVDLERIVGVLKWVTREMDERYKRFSTAGARNIEDFNKHISATDEPMPYIVVIIDELADLMMLAPDETERVITRIAALARATGIHLVIATQRPSVDVVTGLIKANFPARIAFAVAGGVDSRVILDQPGAERLLGRGDMLYMSGDSPAPLRLQGVYVSDNEINNITRYWRSQMTEEDLAARPVSALVLDNTVADSSRMVVPGSERTQAHQQQAFWDSNRGDDRPSSSVSTGLGRNGSDDDDDVNTDQEDELYEESVEMVRRLNKASVSLLQRRLRIGYTRAARLIDRMEEEGIVGPATEGSKPREVLPLK